MLRGCCVAVVAGTAARGAAGAAAAPVAFRSSSSSCATAAAAAAMQTAAGATRRTQTAVTAAAAAIRAAAAAARPIAAERQTAAGRITAAGGVTSTAGSSRVAVCFSSSTAAAATGGGATTAAAAAPRATAADGSSPRTSASPASSSSSRSSSSSAAAAAAAVPDVLVTLGNQVDRITFVSHPGVMAVAKLLEMSFLTEHRAVLTQENVDTIREFDEQLADKAQVAVDSGLAVNFQKLDFFDRPDFVEMHKKEKFLLQQARAEVFAAPKGHYAIPACVANHTPIEIPRRWRSDVELTEEMTRVDPGLRAQTELRSLILEHLTHKRIPQQALPPSSSSSSSAPPRQQQQQRPQPKRQIP